MAISVVTPATTYPVTLAEAKAHCRVDGTAEDSLINGLISAATEYVEQYCGRAIMAQTLKLSLDDFSDEMLLTRGPVQSVTFVKYYDTADTEQTLSGTVYQSDLISDPARIVLADGQSWPTADERANAVNVTYVAGYSAVPAPIKHAILLLIGQWFDSRSDASDKPMSSMPNAVEALLTNYRSFAS